jgi:hypothetical protein
MKTNSTKHWMKVAGLSLAIGTLAFSANAQNTTAGASNQTVITNSAAPAYGTTTAPLVSGAVRLIDNKGTIKYLQVQNGLTAITNKASDGTGVTTTWQLGGSLTNDTYIDAAGKVFAFDNLKVVAAGTAAAASASTVHGASNPAGWTMLVHDEVTGEVKKMLFTDVLQVQAGETTKTVDASFITTPTVTTGATTLNAADYAKVSVYRNGAKLLANVDYTVLAGVVTLVPNSSSTNAEWALYAGDIVEVHWVK